MPLPYEKPANLLQWLDNLGHYILRFGRQILLLLLWSIRLAFLLVILVWHAFLALGAWIRRGRTHGQEPGRARFYLLDPSYEHNFGHYRTVAQYLAEACARRGWLFIHLTGITDLTFSSRIPIFTDPACLPLRAITIKQQHDLKELDPAGPSAKVLARFFCVFRLVLALDRWFATPAQSYFYCHTGDLLYLYAFLQSARLGPRQHLFFTQFYLPPDFEQPREQLRFRRHAHLLARRLEVKPEGCDRVHLCSDSPRLLRSLVPVLGHWPRLLGHPLLRPEILENLPTPENIAHRLHPIGYFGYFTSKHGWPIIHRLLNAQAGRDSRWLLGLNVKNPDPATTSAAEAAAKAARATLHLGYRPDDEYAAALDRCACILLPYSPIDYSFVSSAKLIDALAHGCFPVVPADTWLADIVQTLGYGLIVAENDWPSVPTRLADLDLPALWAARREPIRAFLEQFTARALLDTFVRSHPGATGVAPAYVDPLLLPPESLTPLQRLDNVGRRILRFIRRTRRAFVSALVDRWAAFQLWLLPARLTLQLGTQALILGKRLFQLRRRSRATRRVYLLDPSYQNSFGHYRSVAQHLAEDCARRGWDFIHLTGSLDRKPGHRLPLFPLPARLPIRLAEPFWTGEMRRIAFRKTVIGLGYFSRMMRIAATLDRLMLPEHPAHFVMYTGDFLYFLPLLDSPFLGPRQQLTIFQFYLPLYFGEPSEKKRFIAHARLLGRRFRSATPHATRGLHLGSDSPLLRDLLAPALGAKIPLLYPPFLADLRPEDLPSPDSLAQRPHPFGYFGYLNEKHGWPVIRQLLQSRAGQNTNWLVQFITGRRAATLSDVEAALDAISAAGATALTGYYPPKKFAAALATCSCLLLPYDTDDYAYLSSAKIIDALRHGCFPVVPARTWPAEIVRRAGYGLIVENGQWLDVPAAVAKLDLPALWSQHRSAIFALIQQFTAAHFLDTLEPASPPAALPEN